ncbi:hypothetical protein SDC9_191814 [bioreactor metagenome]|uniref:Uncharacterized protein n=1 Tax=bioreactor metagenome TaxID=1076179 RepID=A0A645I0H9_9ZZZZ
MILDGIANLCTFDQIAELLAGVDGNGEEILLARLGGVNVNTNSRNLQNLGGIHHRFRIFELLGQILLQGIAHEERGDILFLGL